MKIMMVCAGGMSTSLMMKKMSRYWKEIDEPLQICARGLADYREQNPDDYDIVLVGPQVAYRLDSIAGDVRKPCGAISSTDYALGSCDKIYALAKSLYHKQTEASQF